MADFSLNVDISECEQYFAAVGKPDRVKKITRKALRKGAEVIQAAVASEAPERPDLPSGSALPVGALKTDIVVRSTTEDGREVAYVQPGKYTDHVAGWVEFGHQMVTGGRLSKSGKGKGKRTKVSTTGETYTRPDPFFRRGEEKSEAAAVEAIEESLGADLIDPAAKGTDTGSDIEAA